MLNNNFLAFREKSLNDYVGVLPEEVRIELTSDCNLNCVFCFNSGRDIKQLSKKQIFLFIDEIRESGIKAIRFTGGEPFLRKDLKEILKYSKEKGIYTILNTNGTLVSENKNILKYVDDLLISVHDLAGLGGKGALFEKLKKFDLILRACTILTKDNIKNLEYYYQFFTKGRVDDWFMLRPVPTKNNKRPLNREDVIEFTEKIIRFNKKYKILGHISNSVPFCLYAPKKMKGICVGGRNDNGYTRLVVDVEGNIKTDYFSTKILGTILENKLLDVWNSPFLKRIRNYELVPQKCRGCIYLGRCGGGLISIKKTNVDPLLVI